MKFTHCPRPAEGWEFDPTATYDQHRPGSKWFGHPKPVGFWLSIDGDWERWDREEGMGWTDGGSIEFDVDIDKCLLIDTVDALDLFHEEYIKPNTQPLDIGRDNFYRPNWTPLTEQHAGIIIAPYQWGRRLMHPGSVSDWYYGWDVASACIWDLSVVRVKEMADQ